MAGVTLHMPPLPRPSQLLRLAAVLSSIVIVSLYVAYRSGGQTTLPGSKGGVVRMTTATTTPTIAPTTGTIAITSEQQVIYSTKSAPVFKPQTLSGSKFGAVFQPGDAGLYLTTQPTTAPAEPHAQQAAPLQRRANQP